MRAIATKQPTNDSAKQKKSGDKGRSRSISPLSTGMPLLQRKCACGGGCPRCKEELGIQTKLKISEPGDKYEQEADRIAEQIIMPELEAQTSQRTTSSKNLSRTEPIIQRFPNYEADISTSETTEPEGKTAEISESTELEGEIVGSDLSTSMALLVEDDAEGIEPNQMCKSEFLSQLQDEVCTTVNEIIAAQDFSTDNCPYLAYWFDRYRDSDSQHLERVIHRYAPETVGVTTAQDYIDLVVERARQAATRWLNTGEVTGIPEEVPIELLNLPEESSNQGVEDASAESEGIFFKGHDGDKGGTTNPQIIKAQLGSGRALDNEVQSRMGAAFQQDFSQVRLHTDDRAAKLSANLKARAFTIGQDVAFGAGEYQPGTPIGDALIAHELAHVVQQGGARATNETVQKKGGEQRALEEEADRSAVGVVFSLWSGLKQAWGDITVNALPRLKSGLRLQRCPEGCENGCSTREAPTPTPPLPPQTPTPISPTTPTPTPLPPVPTSRCTSTTDPASVIADHRVTPDTIQRPGDTVTISVTFGCRIKDARSVFQPVAGGNPFGNNNLQEMEKAQFTRRWDGKKQFSPIGTFLVDDGDYRHRLQNVVIASSRRGDPTVPDTEPKLISPVIHVRSRAFSGTGTDHFHFTPANVDALAEIIESEMGEGNTVEKTAIAWAVRNQMVRDGTGDVTVARDHFRDAHGAPATPGSRTIAETVLRQRMSADITNGAIKWFSPKRMPLASETCPTDVDCRGGPLNVTNATGGTTRIQAPSWHRDMTYVPIAGAREWLLRAYRL